MFARYVSLGGDPMDSRLVRRFGYRGAALLILGITWILFGFSVLVQPGESRPWVFHELIPVPLRAALWVGAGLVAIVTGLRGADRDDTWGMVAVMVMPLERCVSFAVSWLAYGVSLGAHYMFPAVEVTGYGHGWYGALIWLLVVTLVRLVAGWPNPRRVLAVPGGDVDA